MDLRIDDLVLTSRKQQSLLREQMAMALSYSRDHSSLAGLILVQVNYDMTRADCTINKIQRMCTNIQYQCCLGRGAERMYP